MPVLFRLAENAYFVALAAEKRPDLPNRQAELSKLFDEAAVSYRENPTALHLRAMNILSEGLKEKGALMLVPSSALETMGLGGFLGAAALRQNRLATGTDEA